MDFIKNPYTWIVFTLIILLVSKFICRTSYTIDFYMVLKKHISVFRSNNRIAVLPIITYFIFPLILAISIANIKPVNKDILETITVMMSILISMLITVLALMMDIVNKSSKNDKDTTRVKILKNLVKETYYSIMFEVTTGVVVLLFVFVSLFLDQDINKYISAVIYYLIFIFIFNLLIVLKRIFNILEYDFR